jgi:hypothetical protein
MITASISNCENGYLVSVNRGLFDDTKTWIYGDINVAIDKIRDALLPRIPVTDAPAISREELDKILGTEI